MNLRIRCQLRITALKEIRNYLFIGRVDRTPRERFLIFVPFGGVDVLHRLQLHPYFHAH
jgi:hypothetical protein